MGRHILRVPPGFEHPLDDDGAPVPGAHFLVLADHEPTSCSAYQVYEDVSEGTPVSPVFTSVEDLLSWLQQHWNATYEQAISFVTAGSIPTGVVDAAGQFQNGLAAAPILASVSATVPAHAPQPAGLCPSCGAGLRTARAKQCPACGADWH